MKKTLSCICVLLFSFNLLAAERIVSWKPVPYAAGYIVEIKNSAGKYIIKNKTDDHQYKISLPIGSYQYRVRVLNRLGQVEASSPWLLFEIRAMQHVQKLPAGYTTKSEFITSTEKNENQPYRYVFRAMPSVLIPGGVLGDLFDIGMGLNMSAGIQNLMLDNFEAGIFAGLFYLDGNKFYDIDYSIYTPLGLYCGYNQRVHEKITLFPFVRVGGSLSFTEYTQPEKFKSGTVLSPLGSLGVACSTQLGGYSLSAGVSGSLLAETEGIIPYFEIFIGIGVTL